MSSPMSDADGSLATELREAIERWRRESARLHALDDGAEDDAEWAFQRGVCAAFNGRANEVDAILTRVAQSMATTGGNERCRRIGGLGRPDPDGTEDSWPDTVDALAESAHGLVANVDGPAQGWTQSHAWVEAADRWCARYDRVFATTPRRQETDEDEDVPDADALELIRAKLDVPEDASNDYTLMWLDRWVENGRTLGGTS